MCSDDDIRSSGAAPSPDATRATCEGRGAFVAGIPVDDVTLEEAVDRLFVLVEDGRRTGRSHQVATVNVDFIVNAHADPHLRSILRGTSVSIPDGMPIVWGARLLGSSIRERVAGADLVPALAARAAQTGERLALIGAGPGVAERAARLLRIEHPGLDVVADAGPTFRSVDDLSIIDLDWLVRQQPDICCVAFGNPKQELFIHRFGEELGIPVMIGVGGSLDFLVGVQRRAPMWMQRSGLEWVHRLASNPRRLTKRYLRDGLFFAPVLARQAWSGKEVPLEGGVGFRRRGDHVVIDLSEVRRFDNRAAAELAAAIRTNRRAGRSIEVIGVDRRAVQSVPGLAEWIDDLTSSGAPRES